MHNNTLVENLRKYLKFCYPTFDEPYQLNLAQLYGKLQLAHPVEFESINEVSTQPAGPSIRDKQQQRLALDGSSRSSSLGSAWGGSA